MVFCDMAEGRKEICGVGEGQEEEGVGAKAEGVGAEALGVDRKVGEGEGRIESRGTRKWGRGWFGS